eukprot:TRINITY_DN4138_c1_g2_i2.p4 TRINITY_DN4138_c1_g2~~TRINITY_DN4138_c1_g2_i2.p4  ORF type:complete len:123 (-),score=5.90 TRINITY_DN4138_c1_g2_i2:68-436(-)
MSIFFYGVYGVKYNYSFARQPIFGQKQIFFKLCAFKFECDRLQVSFLFTPFSKISFKCGKRWRLKFTYYQLVQNRNEVTYYFCRGMSVSLMLPDILLIKLRQGLMFVVNQRRGFYDGNVLFL